MTQGRGAPASLRLFVGALLHLRVSDRDGEWRTLRFPVAEVERWLHPGGWTNRRRDWQRLPAALADMRRVTVPLAGVGEVTLVSPTVIPTDPSDPLVEFTVRLPAAAASGARLDWLRLCQYGALSAPAYRAYLAATAAMDRAAYRAGRPRRNRSAPPSWTDTGGRCAVAAGGFAGGRTCWYRTQPRGWCRAGAMLMRRGLSDSTRTTGDGDGMRGSRWNGSRLMACLTWSGARMGGSRSSRRGRTDGNPRNRRTRPTAAPTDAGGVSCADIRVSWPDISQSWPDISPKWANETGGCYAPP